MSSTTNELMHLSHADLRELQLRKLNAVLGEVVERPFYSERLTGISLPFSSLDELRAIPLLQKSDLLAGRRAAPGRVFDLPPAAYCRMHQTSGTKGFPMVVLDTPKDWEWWLRCWDFVLDAADVTTDDVAMMAFSFGPFIGFWTANDALVQRGAMVVPGGGVSSENRIRMILDHRCTVVCCTPTYALHLVSIADQMGISLASSDVTRVIVAGEPGGSVPAIRDRIEEAWSARVVDHTGASEVGAWGFGSRDGNGIHVIETEFIAERLRFDDEHPDGVEVTDGEEGELILTSLGRYGGPAIRYRTGDIVRGRRDHDQPCSFLWLDGGVMGRSDDMMVIRGVNVFPSSVEAMVREVAATAEFRMIATRRNEMDRLRIELESDQDVAVNLARLLRDRLALRIEVTSVDEGTLPRFEAKSRRLIDQRSEGQ